MLSAGSPRNFAPPCCSSTTRPRWMAPMLSFTAEEAFPVFAPGASFSIFTETFWHLESGDSALIAKWDRVHAIREAAYGLGVPRWRTVLSVTLKTASPGIITGCMLAFARVAGETAPLIFTAFGNQFWSFKLTEPIAALPLQIYVYAISPYDEWHRLAWAGSLVLIVLIMASVTLVRIYASRGVLKGAS